MNNKGFVQIKFLAIIFILISLSFVILPKAFSFYNNNNKEKYIEIAKKCIEEVKDNINSSDYIQLPEENQALLVPLSNLKIKATSPYGNFKKEYSYVIVLNLGNYYDYYFTAIDTSYRGIPTVIEKELSIDSVVSGKSNLKIINKISSIDNLYLADTIFEKSESSKQNDKNILLVPVTGELTVPYEFKTDTHKIYDKLLKEIDVTIYNKEATVNNGVLRYDNEIISSEYENDINGVFRYLSFPSDESDKYYSSFVTYNKSYVAGIINESSDYEEANIVFDSRPTVVINRRAKVVVDKDKKYLMWNLMAIHPDNTNYTISECGALIVKNNDATNVNINFDTRGVMIGKSNNGCELGNIFAIRKNNVKAGDRFFARGYIKYKDKNGTEYTSYSRNTVSALVK